MNILILCHAFSPNIGGVETHLDDLCCHLIAKGHNIVVITYQPFSGQKKPFYEKINRLEVYRLPYINLLKRKGLSDSILEFFNFAPLLLFFSMYFLLKKQKELDVIHAHGIISASIAYILNKVFKKKYIVSIHWIINLNKKNRFIKYIIRKILSNSNKILTLSKASADDLIKAGINSDKISVFRYWIRSNIFKPFNKVEAKNLLKLQDKFVVLFVGRLIRVKGVELIIQAAKDMLNYKDLIFVIIGDGPMKNYILNKTSVERLSNIIYIGKVDNDKLPIYYNAADITIIPSIYDEGFGRVVIESLSCGTPVIASKLGGLVEAIDDSVGILIKPNAEALKNAIEYLYHNREILLRKTKNTIAYANYYYSEKNAEIIERELILACRAH